MNNKKKTIYIIITFLIMICTSYLSIIITRAVDSVKIDKDYQKLGLELDEYDIDYYTVYDEDIFGGYKVYKLNVFESKDETRKKIENSNSWSKNKFYEYIMMRFYERMDKETIELDREDLYFYNKGDIYAIYDIKNAKLYYFENGLFNYHKDYSKILELKVRDYVDREIYSVRGGPQDDGLDYYVYKFTEEKGKKIQETLDRSQIWSKEKLPDNILDSFKYNEEVLSIENGYYHYELVCRTRDEEKKKNVTKENATGWEIGVYDADKNILYYYWISI